jgi:hypothetical protein
MAREPSPAVVITAKNKANQYRRLMDIAANQVQNRKRDSLPTFVAGIMTHLGELGPGMIDLIETLTSTAGQAYQGGILARGLSRSKTTAIFRTKLKDALLAANARGFGQALVAAGNPMAGWMLPPDELDMPDWDVHNY